jgi:hypothetical protein
LTDAQIGTWAEQGDTPAALDWSIGTAKFASDVSAGTSAMSNLFLFTNHTIAGNFDVYASAFSLNGALAAGTYWLTLNNATTTGGNPLGWNQDNGPSLALSTSFGAIPSESFQRFGAGTAVPEPAGLVLYSLGALGPLACRRWKG